MSYNVTFEYGNILFDVQYSPFPDSLEKAQPEVAEIFVTPRTAENQLHQEAAGFSTMVSLALQHGASLATLRAAHPKHSSGKPTTWGGEALAVVARDLATLSKELEAA
jgi:hypothetical protein